MRFRLLPLILTLFASTSVYAESTCFGTTSNGRLDGACKIPAKGPNFRSYSTLGRLLGRTYVHCAVSSVLIDSYKALNSTHPEKYFVYGETGKKYGGEFKPHKTHRNGLSVDFMVPVIDERGRSVPIPTGPTNKYGYDLEFDATGSLGPLQIDFEALAAHLAALKAAAEALDVGIWRVILDPELQPFLEETKSWTKIASLQFSKKRSWVRHDEHYHVDFEIPCKPR